MAKNIERSPVHKEVPASWINSDQELLNKIMTEAKETILRTKVFTLRLTGLTEDITKAREKIKETVRVMLPGCRITEKKEEGLPIFTIT